MTIEGKKKKKNRPIVLMGGTQPQQNQGKQFYTQRSGLDPKVSEWRREKKKKKHILEENKGMTTVLTHPWLLFFIGVFFVLFCFPHIGLSPPGSRRTRKRSGSLEGGGHRMRFEGSAL